MIDIYEFKHWCLDLSNHIDTAEKIIGAAATALYNANEVKNRVAIYEENLANAAKK